VNAAIQDAKRYDEEGMIDPLTSLRQQKIFIWTGILDEYLSPGIKIKNNCFLKFMSLQSKLVIVCLLRNRCSK